MARGPETGDGEEEGHVKCCFTSPRCHVQLLPADEGVQEGAVVDLGQRVSRGRATAGGGGGRDKRSGV